ncbi:hypothetical protein BVG16_10850 [Paenibacillus selenitireducens]|uniref:Metallo-beta-lactamase domain-containing protein n=2 Tax=Paenibacillus selenitireducens TaxID=1324314 RepID=A0A1T2XGL0_9BACL|nr:hypothetical protein BVG16_10850 [Paenibacillus selenitireducens]
MVWITVSWVIGMGMACLWQGFVLGLIVTGFLLVTLPLSIYYRLSSVHHMLIYGLVLVCGTLYYTWTDDHNMSRLPDMTGIGTAKLDNAEVTMFGRITSQVALDGDRVSFQMAADEWGTDDPKQPLRISENIMVQIQLIEQPQQQIASTWQRGDHINISGTLRFPGTAHNFGAFDYRAYLRLKHVHWMLQAKGLDSIVTEAPTAWNQQTILRGNDEVRLRLGQQLSLLFTPPHDGYMKGLVIGDSGDLDPEKFRDFSKLGLTHILAISGTHVAVYVGSFLWLFRRLRWSKEKSLLIVMCLIPPYVLISGASPSVIRAGMMSMIALYALRKQILKDGLHILCLAALVMLLWNPYYILDVSFQLSFIVTAGLILWVPRIQRRLPFRSAWLASLVAISSVAQVVSFPLTIYYFNQVSLLSLLANFVFVPLISFIVLPFGSIALVLSFIHPAIANLLVWPTEWLNTWCFGLITWMNQSNTFVMIWASPPIWWILIYYALVEIGVRMIGERKSTIPGPGEVSHEDTLPLTPDLAGHPQGQSRAWKRRELVSRSGYLLVGSLFLLYAYNPTFYDHHGYVQFMDVGQGDSILIRTPEGKHMLVDGSGTVRFGQKGDEWKAREEPYEVGRELLVPLLKQRGVHQLDALILTHEDQDHAGGLQAVLEEIPVKAFIFNGTFKPNASMSKLFRTALDQDIPLYQANPSIPMQLDTETKVQFIYPTATLGDSSRITLMNEQNDHSVVFLLHMKHARVLFTGDIEQGIEQEIVEQLERLGGKSASRQGSVDVLKVAHHGSKTSTSERWLDYWNPRTAVISVGEHNTFGHPSPQVIDRLEQMGIDIYRTDLYGEVQMRIHDNSIDVRRLIE